MRLGPGSHPGAEEGLGGVCSGFSDELVSRLTERTIRTKSDCLEADAQVLVADDLVGPAVLGGGVGVGAGSTYLLLFPTILYIATNGFHLFNRSFLEYY